MVVPPRLDEPFLDWQALRAMNADLRSFLSLPLWKGELVWGVATFASTATRAFPDRHVQGQAGPTVLGTRRD